MKRLILKVTIECNDAADVGFESPIIKGLQSMIELATRGGIDDYEWTDVITKATVTHDYSEEPLDEASYEMQMGMPPE